MRRHSVGGLRPFVRHEVSHLGPYEGRAEGNAELRHRPSASENVSRPPRLAPAAGEAPRPICRCPNGRGWAHARRGGLSQADLTTDGLGGRDRARTRTHAVQDVTSARVTLFPREQNLVHHSGSGWLATPSPWPTCTSYSLPASWRSPSAGFLRNVTYCCRLVQTALDPGRSAKEEDFDA